MSTGGPTWDTAGALTLGSGNTFALTNVTEAGSARPYQHGWWVYSPPAAGTLTLDTLLSSAGDAGAADTIIQVYDNLAQPSLDSWEYRNDDTTGTLLSRLEFPVAEGTTWHILVGTYDSDGDTLTTYRLRAAFTPAPILIERHTAWIDDLVDDPDNQLVISGVDGPFGNGLDLQATQVAEAWRASKPFYHSVLDSSLPGRQGQWTITESFPAHAHEAGSENPTGDPEGSGNTAADECAFSHAINGDQDTVVTGQVWNTDTYDLTLGGPPACRPLGTGDADSFTNTDGGFRYYHRFVTDFLLGDNVQATDGMGARALWIGRLLGDLQDFYGNDDYHLGTLPYPERPVGVPDDAVLEFESELELTYVKGAADRVNRSDYTGLPVSFYVNDPILPSYTGGWSVWQKGAPSAATFTGYGNETTPPLYDFGINSWADTNDPDEGIPDAVIGTGVDVTERPTLAVGDYSIGADSTLTVIIGFNSPRYRWTWTEELPTTRPSPVRVIGRKNDGLTRSGTQTIRRNTAQRSIRTLGAQR